MYESSCTTQLCCKTCREKYGKGRSEHGAAQYCFTTTSQFFWKGWEHWRIPCRQCSSQKMKLSSHTVGHRNCSLFLSRTAVTHELFDLVVELCPSSTSAGLAENIK